MIEKIISFSDYRKIKKIIDKKEIDLEDIKNYYILKSRIRGRESRYFEIKGDSRKKSRKHMQFYFSLLSSFSPIDSFQERRDIHDIF